MATRSQIMQQFATASAALSASESEIKAARQKIFDSVPDSGATPQQETNIQKLRGALGDVLDARNRLAVITADQLDDSDDVKELASQMKQINASLQDDLDDLKGLVDNAEQIAAAAKYISQVTASVAQLAAQLASVASPR